MNKEIYLFSLAVFPSLNFAPVSEKQSFDKSLERQSASLFSFHVPKRLEFFTQRGESEDVKLAVHEFTHYFKKF